MRITLLVATIVLVSASGFALPILAIDADPGAPGTQDAFSVELGYSFVVDVLITGVEFVMPLNAFELDVAFENTLVVAGSITPGDFLLPPAVVVQSDVAAPEIDFGMLTLLPAGAVGSGRLASISFDAVALGSTVLDLNDVVLSSPFGLPLLFDGLEDATITVREPVAAPEPGSLSLSVLALLSLLGLSHRDRKGATSV